MPIQPDKKLEQILFAEQHFNLWLERLATIGLSTAQANAVKSSTTAARAAYTAALAARQASKAATTQADNDISDMKSSVADALKAIRLYAETTNNPDVYAIAQIPPPAQPTPALPPTKPVDVSFTIQPSGALTLMWTNAASSAGYDASNNNVIYTIRRKMNNQSAFVIVGAVPAARSGRRGLTNFTDDTLPTGATNIQYMVVPQRGTLTGPMSEVFSVRLGIGSGGAPMVVSTSSAEPGSDLRMAA